MANQGGRMPASEYGRPAQAKGVGKNSKRHDLERPKTPGLHGSDLQQGDVQALEDGQRIAPASTQRPANPAQSGGGGQPQRPQAAPSRPVEIPDAIDFFGERQGSDFNLPNPERRVDVSKAMTWLPILRQLANGPGASPALVSAFVDQARKMAQAGAQPATIVDMNAADEGIEAMLDAGIR